MFSLNINNSAVSYELTGPRSTERLTYENGNHVILGLFGNNISIYITGNGTAVLVYCDMKFEGY